jgi:peptidoglycan/LPS O-acetylase OafA/YrhL
VILQTHYLPIQGVYLPTVTVLLTGLFIVFSEKTVTDNQISASKKGIRKFIYLINPFTLIYLIGTFSYEFYLINIPLMKILGLTCEPNTFGCSTGQFFPIFIFLAATSLALAFVMHVFLDKVTLYGLRKAKL